MPNSFLHSPAEFICAVGRPVTNTLRITSISDSGERLSSRSQPATNRAVERATSGGIIGSTWTRTVSVFTRDRKNINKFGPKS